MPKKRGKAHRPPPAFGRVRTQPEPNGVTSRQFIRGHYLLINAIIATVAIFFAALKRPILQPIFIDESGLDQGDGLRRK